MDSRNPQECGSGAIRQDGSGLRQLPDPRSLGQDIVRLVELTEAKRDDIALDVATGGGHTALALAPHVGQIVASDLTPRMLDAAREHILGKGIENASFEIADAESMPFDDESFDIVTCRIAPHHFSDITAFAREVARVLKPGGRFVLMDSISPDDDELDAFINELEQRRDQTHVRSYRLSEWTDTLEAAGLTVDHHEPVVRGHEYESWTARSRMTPEDRKALDEWILATPEHVREHFGVAVEDGKIKHFVDFKELIRARK
ncbi:MAG: methyltransferase domain-containing protein [Thermomicrobiales bacterium]